MITTEKTFFSFLWVLTDKFGYSFISLISTLVLARLLSPYEFGLIGTVTIFVSVSNMLVEGGFGAALVQKKVVENRDYSTVFIFNALMSIILYILLFFTASLIAKYYNNPIYTSIIRVLGLNLLINAFTLTQRVHIIRELEFKKQTIINITSLSLSVIIAFILAFMNYGVWALVFQLVSYSFFTSLLMFIHVRFLPSMIFSKDSFKQLFSFGGKIIINSALGTIYNDAFGMIITKRYSTSLTGFYTQAKKLVSYPSSIFLSLYDNAGFPILSRIEDEKIFKNELSKINKGVFSLAVPLLLIIPFQATNIITILLGDKWIDSAPILAILSISLITSLISNFSISVLKARGRGNEILRYGILNIIIGISILLITIHISFNAIIYGIVLTNTLYSFIIFHMLTKITMYKWRDLLSDLGFLVFAVLFINTSVTYIISILNIESKYWELLTFLLLALTCVFVYFFIFEMKTLKSYRKILFKK